PPGWPLACVRLRFYALVNRRPWRVLLCGGALVLLAGAGLGHADEDLGEFVQVRAGPQLGFDPVVTHPLRRTVLGLGGHVSSPVSRSMPAKNASSASRRAATSSRT